MSSYCGRQFSQLSLDRVGELCTMPFNQEGCLLEGFPYGVA